MPLLSGCCSISANTHPQIHSEVTEFWGVLETVAAARHAELLGILNKHLAELSQKVSGEVGLNVRSIECK